MSVGVDNDGGYSLLGVKCHFEKIIIQIFTHPYHQPPEPPTFEWLNREFGQFLGLIK